MSKTAINFGIGAGTGYAIGFMILGAVVAVVITHVLDIGYEG